MSFGNNEIGRRRKKGQVLLGTYVLILELFPEKSFLLSVQRFLLRVWDSYQNLKALWLFSVIRDFFPLPYEKFLQKCRIGKQITSDTSGQFIKGATGVETGTKSY